MMYCGTKNPTKCHFHWQNTFQFIIWYMPSCNQFANKFLHICRSNCFWFLFLHQWWSFDKNLRDTFHLQSLRIYLWKWIRKRNEDEYHKLEHSYSYRDAGEKWLNVTSVWILVYISHAFCQHTNGRQQLHLLHVFSINLPEFIFICST